jgi:hypothetical protein
MKTQAVLSLTFLLSAAQVNAQLPYDSARYQHLKDSAWTELRSYDYYGWAFEWDSMYLLRWSSWTCVGIHEREDMRRAKEESRLRKRNEEDDEAFPEYNETKKYVAKKN